ncbi:MAG: hypothetical protein ACKOFP_04545, partial [Actinomycetota bacterium]
MPTEDLPQEIAAELSRAGLDPAFVVTLIDRALAQEQIEGRPLSTADQVAGSHRSAVRDETRSDTTLRRPMED